MIRNRLPDLQSYAELFATLQELKNNQIYNVSTLLQQFHHLIETFDQFMAISQLLHYEGNFKELFKCKGDDWFPKQIDSADKMIKIFPLLTPVLKDREIEHPWLESLAVSLVKNVGDYEFLHAGFFKHYFHDDREQILNKLVIAVLPQLTTPQLVGWTLRDFFPSERESKEFFCKEFAKQFALRNPNLEELLIHIAVFRDNRSSKVSYADSYREQRFVFENTDFGNHGLSLFMKSLADYLPQCIRTEADLQLVENELPHENEYLKYELYKMLDSHLSKIVADAGRLRALRIKYNLPVEADKRSAWTRFTTFVHESVAPADSAVSVSELRK